MKTPEKRECSNDKETTQSICSGNKLASFYIE